MQIPEQWTVKDGVYEPREDSRLMASALAEHDFAGKTVMDMGTGTGLLTYTLLQQGAEHVTAVDVNPAALANAETNIVEHVPDADVQFVVSDLFEHVDGRFDVIVFNPPYVPGEEELGTLEERSWAGGEQGRETIDRFLRDVCDYVRDAGEVFLLQSSVNDVDQTLDRIREQGFDAGVVAEEKVPWERLVVIRAAKPVE